MIECFYLDVTALSDPDQFALGMQCLPWEERKEKNLRFRFDAGKRLSLGAGLLAAYGLRKAGAVDLTLGTEAQGKPYLLHEPGIFFNLSHSGTLAICAVGDVPVGADVEEEQKLRDGVARLSFTQEEQDWLAAQADPDRAFVRLWTRKESCLKLSGTGFYQSPQTVNICPGMEPEGQKFYEKDVPGHHLCVCTQADAVSFSEVTVHRLTGSCL